jgi:hypothetical protein
MKYIVVLVFCLFMGMMGCSLGVGAAFPPINLVAQPVFCPDGEMDYEQTTRQSTRRSSGGTRGNITEADWTCEDPPGTVEPISKAALTGVAGSFYGLVMFFPLALVIAFASKGRKAKAAQMQAQMQARAQAMGQQGYGQGPRPPGQF